MLKLTARCNSNAPGDHGNQSKRQVAFVGTNHHDSTLIDPSVLDMSGAFTLIGDRGDDVDFNYGDEIEITFKVKRTAAEVKAAVKQVQDEKEAAEKLAAEQAASNSTLQPAKSLTGAVS